MVMKRLLFIYNPHSGKGTIRQSLSDIIHIFIGAGYTVTVLSTDNLEGGNAYLADIQRDYDIVVYSGGDGMAHGMVCSQLEGEERKAYGLIPAGTVNDFAGSLNIPKYPAEAARVIVGGNYADIDVGCFNDSRFAYIAAFGLFVDISYSTDQEMKNKIGSGAYYLNALKSMNLQHFHDMSTHMTIQWDGGLAEDDFVFGMAGNTASVAGLKKLVPADAAMDDGLLDGLFIKTPKTASQMSHIKKAILKRDYDVPEIVSVKSGYFEVEAETDIPWTLDGEFGGRCSRADISVIPKALKIAVPEK